MTDLEAPPERREFPPALRNTIAAVVVVGALVGLFFTGRAAVTGNANTSKALPDSVNRLVPDSGAEVLRQSKVGVDVANGYDAYLIINGKEIKTEKQGLTKDLGVGLVQFQPGPDTEIPSLQAEKNCVIAMVYKQVDGPKEAKPVFWCFNAT